MTPTPRRRRAALAGALAAAVLVTAGCETRRPEPQVTLVQPDCYTVDPFQPIRIAPPTAGAPANHADLLGAWGGGAWDGAICHDLWVMQVDENGGALVFDAHGPGFHPDATAFTRRGEVGRDGRLRVRQGAAQVEYWVENGQLHGLRRSGQRVQRIILTRRT